MEQSEEEEKSTEGRKKGEKERTKGRKEGTRERGREEGKKKEGGNRRKGTEQREKGKGRNQRWKLSVFDIYQILKRTHSVSQWANGQGLRFCLCVCFQL